MPDQLVLGLINIGEPQPSGNFLLKKLESTGYEVFQYKANELGQLDKGIKTFILNLYDNDINIDELLQNLSDRSAKVIFNDAIISNDLVGWNKNRWLRHVLHKVDQVNDILPKALESKNDSDSGIDLSHLGIESVWLLAASIGGPESLIKFFKEFTGDEPILFVIVQHMDSEFVAMMQKQLDKNGQIPVSLAVADGQLKPGHALLVPVDEDIVLTSKGLVGVKDFNPNRMSTPCIDDVCFDLLENLSSLNMAVFSGMATDGIVGATNVYENGGKVITQSASSCVVSAIAEEVRKKNMSMFDGNPAAMAQYVKENTIKR